MKIPIKEAVNSGAWLQCHSKMYDKYFDFRLRLLSFEKINLSDMDDLNEIKEFNFGQGRLWLMKKEDLIPLYEELKGYLSQAPKSTDPFNSMYDASIWNQYNETVKLISKVTGEDYERFCLVPITDEPLTCVRIDTYRQKLNGLISRLKAEYSLDKPQPVKVPNTVITLTQQQNQSIHIQIVLEIQSKIDEHISHYQEGSKERNFLNKLKESLSSVSNISQLISHILKIAKDMGLDIADIARFFN